MLRKLSFAILISFPVLVTAQADEPVFSGPQVGETLPSFQTLAFSGGYEGKSIDLIEVADGGPLMIVFVHELTRPGFSLTRAVTSFAADRENQGMTVGVVFLTDDVTQAVKRVANIQHLLADDIIVGVSPDGKEGPGSYGLNRNVTLTILVADDGKVTANDALVQPQGEADGPAILQAIAAVTGGGEVPSMKDLDARYAPEMRMQRGAAAGRPMAQLGTRGESDPQLIALLRTVINKGASQEQVQEAAAKVDAYIKESASARKELARITSTVVKSGKLEMYGTPMAQEILKKWLEVLSDENGGGDESPAAGSDDSGDDDKDDDDKDEV